VRHTAQAGNQPVAAAEEARSATTGRVWATFMMVVESVLVRLGQGQTDAWTAWVWTCLKTGKCCGERSQFEGLECTRPPTRRCLREAPMALRN
jgi:hypothetical protein